MSVEDVVDSLVDASKRLIDESPNGIVDGDDVAREIGRDPFDSEVKAAFELIGRRGLLKVDSQGGDSKLPHAVQLA